MTTRLAAGSSVLSDAWAIGARIPAYPSLIAATFLLTGLDEFTPLQVLARPLVILIAVTITAQLVASITARNRDQGAYFAALLLVVAVDHLVAALLFLAATIPLIVGTVRSRHVAPLDWPRLTGFVNTVSAIALAMNVATTAATGVLVLVGTSGPSADAPPTAPDIYLLMLDGYPRADTLVRDFGFDNRAFLESMSDAGFAIAEEAHSNYNMTVLTLASMLNMAHVGSLMPAPPEARAQGRDLVRLMNEGDALRELRRHGYTVVAIPSGVASMELYGADRFLDSGQVNSLEVSLMRAGWLPRVLPELQRSWFHQQQRERIHATFARLGDLATETAAGPRFVFAHVMAPHPPMVFEADGSPRDGWGCFPEVCGLWDQLYDAEIREPVLDQVAYLNTLVLDTTRRIIEKNERPAVVIVFSDHGFRHDLDDRDEMLRSLLLSYSPGRAGLFPPDASPINIVPRILNGYLGTNIPLATEESYITELRRVSTDGHFPLVPWPP